MKKLNSMWVEKTPIGVCLKQRYFEFEISVAFEGTSVSDTTLTRADLRVYQDDKDVTSLIMDQYEKWGDPDDVLWNPNMPEIINLLKCLDYERSER